MKRILKLFLMVLIANGSYSQGGNTGNNFLGSFLGWNNTNGANPLQFRTNNINRLVLNGNLNSTVNNVTFAADGFMGLNTTSPFSRLHIAQSGIPGGGYYRDWMPNGFLQTYANHDIL